MGLLDKIKNLFTDEEEILEEEIEEIVEKKPKIEKKEKVEENPLPTFMREKIEKEQRIKIQDDEEVEKVSDITLTREHREIKENNNFKFPIAFDDQDFEPIHVQTPPVVEIIKKEEVKKPINLYNSNSSKNSSKKEVKKFKPTPIISPVYGILDKNYKKEEVKSKPENTYQITRASSKKVDFESVRMKAFGSFNDEISDNLLHDSLVDDTNVEVIDPSNLLYEVTTDKDTTIENAIENYYDFGVTYEIPKQEIKQTVPIDNEIKIINHNEEEEIKAEKIEVKEQEVDTLNSTVVEDATKESDLELTEDLFSLIDAMYDERNGN